MTWELTPKWFEGAREAEVGGVGGLGRGECEHSREEIENPKTLRERIALLIENSKWWWNNVSEHSGRRKSNLGGSFSYSREFGFYFKCGKLETIPSHTQHKMQILYYNLPTLHGFPPHQLLFPPLNVQTYWCYFCSLNISSLSVPQDLCTYRSSVWSTLSPDLPVADYSHHWKFSQKIILGRSSLAVLVS